MEIDFLFIALGVGTFAGYAYGRWLVKQDSKDNKQVALMSELSLGPDDNLVVFSEDVLGEEAIRHIREEFKDGVPKSNVLVLSQGLRLGVIRKTGRVVHNHTFNKYEKYEG